MRPFILALTFLAAGQTPAHAEKRVALVIGNSAYEKVAPLTNPANDATAMTATLKDAGFDVIESRRNLKAAEMTRALRDFSEGSRCRCGAGLLRRSRRRDRRHQLSHSD